ncbi:MAG TPA: glycosyltransferase family 2 protein [Gemmataceae bacterium]|jgi:dolichol-phosphate mannosyltransferase|nr:glycosyltransferase family 2 protein [Gemmataceae bacterium]
MWYPQPTPNDKAGLKTGMGDQITGYRLSLVLPAWNEGETIGQALREAEAALSSLADDYEIIIVDDGSSDGTAAIAAGVAADNPRIRLVKHEHNRGYGAALRSGFQAATLDLVAFTDADCQFDLSELRSMLPLTRQHDVICGYRLHRHEGVRRRFFSWGYNRLVKMLLGSPVRDIDCALKIFQRRQLLALLPAYDNFFVNTEMIARARCHGLSLIEVGVHHRPRAAGHSKVSLLDIPRTLRALLPFWWSLRIRPLFARRRGRR